MDLGALDVDLDAVGVDLGDLRMDLDAQEGICILPEWIWVVLGVDLGVLTLNLHCLAVDLGALGLDLGDLKVDRCALRMNPQQLQQGEDKKKTTR